MIARNSLVLGAFFTLALQVGSAAAAPPQAAEVGRADALFQEGKKLLEQARFDEACDRLAKSDALDPAIGTLGLLAACHEQQGRTATAWAEYRATAKRAEAAGDNRGDYARQRAATLEAELPRLMIRVEKPIAGLEIFRNLERVPAESFGADLPVDPGAYEILARAPQRQEYRVTITAKEGVRLTLEVPELKPVSGAAPAPAAPPAKPAPPAPPVKRALDEAAAPRPIAPAPPEPGGGGLRTVGVIVGGVGLLGLGVGAAFGATAISNNVQSTTLQQTCKTPAECAVGQDLRSRAFRDSSIATAGIVTGAAGVVAGAVLLLIPSSRRATGDKGRIELAPVVGQSFGGALVKGSF